MTVINWERLNGESLEELVAGLLVLANPAANQITPAGGDGGVDVRVWTPDGFRIYQIKRYSAPLRTIQARAVESSWHTFVDQTLGTMPVVSWTLVMPWNPSRQRLTWLNDLTKDAGITTSWMGRTQLDALAAMHPAAVEYYLGDGADRIQRLMARALDSSDPPSASGGAALLVAGIERHQALASTLSEIDPFYRYEINVRAGVLDDNWFSGQSSPVDAALITYQQLDASRYVETQIFPLSRLSHVLRPISTTVHFDVSTDPAASEAVRMFQLFGAPLDRIPATTTDAQGPPGTTINGSGLVSFMTLPGSANALPELEFRLVDSNLDVLHRIDLVDLEYSRGATGNGIRLSGWDPSHSMQVEAMFGSEHQADQLRLSSTELAGKPPRTVLAAVQFRSMLAPGLALEIAVRGGRALLSGWDADVTGYETFYDDTWPTFVEALTEIQAHTLSKIVIPSKLTRATYEEVIRAARLLRNEVLVEEWEGFSMVVGNPESIGSEPEFAMLLRQPMTVNLNNQLIELDRTLQVHFPAVRRRGAGGSGIVKAGDLISLTPGSVPKASFRAF